MAKSKREKRERRVTSARRRVTEHQSGLSLTSLNVPEGVQLFQIKEAKTYRFDIIPYVVKKGSDEPGGNPFADEGDTYYERTFYTHRIGTDNQAYVCLSKTFRQHCPVCEARAKLMRDPDHDEELVKSLAPKERQVFNVIDVSSDEGREKGIQLFEYSHHLFGKMLDAKIKSGDDGEYDLFADLQEGVTVKATFEKESGGGYSFFKCTMIEFKPRKTTYDDELLDDAVDLESVPREFDYKELKKIYEGGGPDDEDEDDDKPAKKGKKGAGKSKKVDEDDDDEDEEEDADDDSSSEDEEAEIEVGSTVSFTYRKKNLTGDVTEIIKRKGKEPLVYVEVEGRSEPYNVDLSELTLVEDEEEEEEEEEEEKPAKKKPGRPKKKVKEEDEEEDEDDDDGDDEDDEPPAKKKGSKPAPAKKKSKKDDDEEEDDDEESDDDDDDDWDDD